MTATLQTPHPSRIDEAIDAIERMTMRIDAIASQTNPCALAQTFSDKALAVNARAFLCVCSGA